MRKAHYKIRILTSKRRPFEIRKIPNRNFALAKRNAQLVKRRQSANDAREPRVNHRLIDGAGSAKSATIKPESTS